MKNEHVEWMFQIRCGEIKAHALHGEKWTKRIISKRKITCGKGNTYMCAACQKFTRTLTVWAVWVSDVEK